MPASKTLPYTIDLEFYQPCSAFCKDPFLKIGSVAGRSLSLSLPPTHRLELQGGDP